MSILANAGLVESTKKGRWVYYRLVDRKNAPEGQLLNLLPQLLENETQPEEDRQALRDILKLDPETLCRIQSERN